MIFNDFEFEYKKSVIALPSNKNIFKHKYFPEV